MATWDAWPQQLLAAANIPFGEGVANFMVDWNAHASSNCANNPVDISHAETGAANCKRLTRRRTSKKYVSHDQAATAFATQIHSGAFPHLLAALKAPVPYQQPKPADVEADLRKWGSLAFADYYAAHSQSGTGSGTGGGSGGQAPHTHAGWTHLQHSVNNNMPKRLNRSAANNRAALRALTKARKVRL